MLASTGFEVPTCGFVRHLIFCSICCSALGQTQGSALLTHVSLQQQLGLLVALTDLAATGATAAQLTHRNGNNEQL
jgi:hypothetical protein